MVMLENLTFKLSLQMALVSPIEQPNHNGLDD